MNWKELTSDYEIIGSTIKPTSDALPMRLSPVYKKRGEDSVWFLSSESDDDSTPELFPEAAEWLSEQLAVVCEPPILPRPGHWLMQLRAGEKPEYLARGAVSERLLAVYQESVAEADRALGRGDEAAARSLLFFASRAHPELPPNEPLPQLALIPLLRSQIGPEDMAFFVKDIENSFRPDQIRAALSKIKSQFVHQWFRLQSDPALPSLQGPAEQKGCFLDRVRKSRMFPHKMETLRKLWTPPPRRAAPHLSVC